MDAMNNASGTYDGKTPVSVLADNLIRRALRISDPRNAKEVAQGLGRAYPRETAELDEEIQGLPIGLPAPALVLAGNTPSIAGRELVQAQNNMARDLDFLTGSSQLKEVQVELQGWGETIRTWLADGAAAANQALDAAARDRVFSARRYLLDYAWLARLVGSQTPGLSIAYRRFARSLDEAAGLLLVSAGETLSRIGYSGDRLLLAAPVSELSARADAASAALRNWSGSVQDAFSPTAWPWGLVSYRKLLERLEEAGHGDLRALLQEDGLRMFTDELVDRASSSDDEDGMRRLAATQVVALERVKRLINVGSEFAEGSPPLAAFLNALGLFVDTFRGGDATRLIALGRPLLASAGLYLLGGLDAGTQRLQTLVQYRSTIAQLNDRLFGTDLTPANAQAQFVADSCLYALDLAIDLYAVGVNPAGQGLIEQRAAAYGLFMQNLLTETKAGLAPMLLGKNPVMFLMEQSSPPGQWYPPGTNPSVYLLIYTLIQAINALGQSKSPPMWQIPQDTWGINLAQAALVADVQRPLAGGVLNATDRQLIARELAIIESRHSGLLPLVNALTPGNFNPSQVLSPINAALQAAKNFVGGGVAASINVPPPIETTLRDGLRDYSHGTLRPLITEITDTPVGGQHIIIITGATLDRATMIIFSNIADTADQRVFKPGGIGVANSFNVNSDQQITIIATGLTAADEYDVIVVAQQGTSEPITYMVQ